MGLIWDPTIVGFIYTEKNEMEWNLSLKDGEYTFNDPLTFRKLKNLMRNFYHSNLLEDFSNRFNDGMTSSTAA